MASSLWFLLLTLNQNITLLWVIAVRKNMSVPSCCQTSRLLDRELSIRHWRCAVSIQGSRKITFSRSEIFKQIECSSAGGHMNINELDAKNIWITTNASVKANIKAQRAYRYKIPIIKQIIPVLHNDWLNHVRTCCKILHKYTPVTTLEQYYCSEQMFQNVIFCCSFWCTG